MWCSSYRRRGAIYWRSFLCAVNNDSTFGLDNPSSFGVNSKALAREGVSASFKAFSCCDASVHFALQLSADVRSNATAAKEHRRHPGCHRRFDQVLNELPTRTHSLCGEVAFAGGPISVFRCRLLSRRGFARTFSMLCLQLIDSSVFLLARRTVAELNAVLFMPHFAAKRGSHFTNVCPPRGPELLIVQCHESCGRAFRSKTGCGASFPTSAGSKPGKASAAPV